MLTRGTPADCRRIHQKNFRQKPRPGPEKTVIPLSRPHDGAPSPSSSDPPPPPFEAKEARMGSRRCSWQELGLEHWRDLTCLEGGRSWKRNTLVILTSDQMVRPGRRSAGRPGRAKGTPREGGVPRSPLCLAQLVGRGNTGWGGYAGASSLSSSFWLPLWISFPPSPNWGGLDLLRKDRGLWDGEVDLGQCCSATAPRTASRCCSTLKPHSPSIPTSHTVITHSFSLTYGPGRFPNRAPKS